MVDTAVQLLHKIRSWLEKKEICAKYLWKLVKELEDLRQKCNAGECLGNTVSVLGAACLLGGAVATFCTAGAAAPVLGVLGAAYVGTGATITVSSKLIEHFVSGSTMEDAKKAAKESEKIEEEILKLIEKLKKERVNPIQDASEYIAMRISEAMSGMGHKGRRLYGVIKDARALLVLCHIFLHLSIKKQGKISTKLVTTIVLELAVAGGKSAAKACSMAVAGGIGMVFALPESIDSWKELVMEKHVTKASQSLRDTAENIDKLCNDLRDNLQRLQEEIEQTKQQTNQQTNNHQGNQSNQNQSTNNHQGEDLHCGKKRRKYTSDRESESDSTASDLDSKSESEDDSTSYDTSETEERDNDGEGYLKMGLLNCRSMAQNPDLISELIEDEELDVFLTTETWLTPENYKRVLTDACPFDFEFQHEARQDDTKVRGGGVAIQNRKVYKCKQIWFPTIKGFEYLAVKLENEQWGVPVILVNLYFPNPNKQFHLFKSDFNNLLDDLKSKGYNHVIITGDFNLHMDNPEDCKAAAFDELLTEWDLKLHIDKPTHNKGHTLDLVLTWNVDIRNVEYKSTEFSDHFIILFEAKVSLDRKRKP